MVAAGFAAIAGGPSNGQKKNTETNKLDVSQSTIAWHAKKVTGEHFGDLRFYSGTLTINDNKVTGGDFEMDMTSIAVKDLQGEWAGKLEGHLKSEDFFSVDKYKTSALRIKSMAPIAGAKAGENNYNVVADLTIKGITNEVSFPAMIIVKKDEVIANAELNIDRSKFDVRYGSVTFFPNIGDKMINNDFNIKVRVVAKRNKV